MFYRGLNLALLNTSYVGEPSKGSFFIIIIERFLEYT